MHPSRRRYFLVTLPEGAITHVPGTEGAEIYLKSGEYGCCLELTHNHGTENDPAFKCVVFQKPLCTVLRFIFTREYSEPEIKS